VFFCKENFGDVPQALSVKGLDGLSDTSNVLDRPNFSVILHCSICTLPFTLFGSGSSGLGNDAQYKRFLSLSLGLETGLAWSANR